MLDLMEYLMAFLCHNSSGRRWRHVGLCLDVLITRYVRFASKKNAGEADPSLAPQPSRKTPKTVFAQQVE